MTGDIRLLQLAVGALWLLPLLMFSPAVYRVWQRTHTTADLLVAGYPVIALGMLSGLVRWLVFPDVIHLMGGAEIVFWAGIYVFFGLIILLLLVIARAWWTR